MENLAKFERVRGFPAVVRAPESDPIGPFWPYLRISLRGEVTRAPNAVRIGRRAVRLSFSWLTRRSNRTATRLLLLTFTRISSLHNSVPRETRGPRLSTYLYNLPKAIRDYRERRRPSE
jgi:hypothetical protein